MFWIVRIFVMLALAAVVVIGLGFLLPEERVFVKTTLIDAPLSRVYEIVTDVDKQAAWRSDVKTVHVERRGDLWAWTEEQNGGTTFTLEEIAKRPQKFYEFKYTTSSGVRGHWIGEFDSLNDERTKLTLTQTVVIENPLRRVAAYVMMNLDTVMDIYLGDLNRFASQPEPTLDPLLRGPMMPPTAATPSRVDEPVSEPRALPQPSASPASFAPPTPSPTPIATPTPSAIPSPTALPPLPITPAPSLTVPTAAPTPSALPIPSAVPTPIAPPTPSAVPTSTSVTIPTSPALPPNTPSLLSPSALPTATPRPTATATPSALPSSAAP